MRKLKPMPEFINGFKILEDLGTLKKGRPRTVRVLCKNCNAEYTTPYPSLLRSKGCRSCQYSLKPLPEFINGFRIIEDLGLSDSLDCKKRRRFCIAECKKCGNHFKANASILPHQNACSCTHNLPKDILENKRLLQIRLAMIARCYHTHVDNYPRYGGSGITICDEWLNDSYAFCRWALANGYENHLTIDRIDSKANYCPENCRWVTITEQARNTKKNVVNRETVLLIREDLKTMRGNAVAKKYGICSTVVSAIKTGKTWKDVF